MVGLFALKEPTNKGFLQRLIGDNQPYQSALAENLLTRCAF